MGNSNRRMPKRVEEFDYVIIPDLEDQLERSSSRYQQICEDLEELREDFTSRYNALQQDTFDMMEHLKLCLAQQEEQLSELMESLASLQQEFQENQKLAFENRVLADSKLPGQETSSLSGPSAPADLAPQRAGLPAGHLSYGNAATRQ